MFELMPLLMFAGLCSLLLLGYPVAWTLAGGSLIFALIGYVTGSFDASFIQALPNRLFGVMTNETLMAVPLFVFMGVMLEKAKIAEDLLEKMSLLFGGMRGGLGLSVILVGALLAASTGIVGATVVTMGLLSLPTMLKHGYSPSLSAGAICASGTLGQIIPPSIVLVLLGDVLSSAYQQAQLDQGIFSPETVSVGDLFAGALIPGLILVALYITYMLVVSWLKPSAAPAVARGAATSKFSPTVALVPLEITMAIAPPLLLVFCVLGSILFGVATPTEAAAVGAMGALILAVVKGRINTAAVRDVCQSTAKMSSMVFMILLGAALFSLVFRGFGGDDLVHEWLSGLPGGKWGALVAVMLLMFLLGFVLDFIEIVFIVVPLVGPVLLAMDIDPVWLGIMIAVNLQTSFLTPPFGFALFFLRGVAPKELATADIYRGVMPFIGIQLLMLALLAAWPALATWLPKFIYS